MSTLFDIFGFLNVVLHGLDFVAQSVLLGSVAFAVLVATPLAGEVQRELRPVLVGCRRVIQAAALAVVVAVTATTVVNAAVLAASLTVSWREVAGAGFVIAGAAKVIIAAMIGLLASIGSVPAASTRSALGVAVALAPGGASGALAGRAQVAGEGRWKLRWHVLSLDGHITRGEVSFSSSAPHSGWVGCHASGGRCGVPGRASSRAESASASRRWQSRASH